MVEGALRVPVRLMVAVLGILTILVSTAPLAHAGDGYPKVMNYFLRNDLSASEMQLLAQWDVLVLDADFPLENPNGLLQLRTFNPDIILLAFIPMSGAFETGPQRPPNSILYQYYMGADAGDFWLYGEDGSHIYDWPLKWTCNLTQHSPVNAQSEQFWQWLPRFVDEVVWQNGTTGWDGIMLDGVLEEISWVNDILGNAMIDADADGSGDVPTVLDSGWKDYTVLAVQEIRRRLGSSVPIMSNGNNAIYADLNGNMVENFPYQRPPDQGNEFAYAWRAWMFDEPGAYLPAQGNFETGLINLTAINSYWQGDQSAPVDSAHYESHVRFTLASALLGDGYYSFDWAWFDHGSLWWLPEYDIFIGDPVGVAYAVDVNGVEVWRRNYTNAIVVVNPNNASVPAWNDQPAVTRWDAYIGPPTSVTAVPDPGAHTPALLLQPAYPNPFQAGTRLSYELAEPGRVTLTVHDVQGRLLTTLVSGRETTTGSHDVVWDGTDSSRRALNPGIYFAKLQVGDEVTTTKVIKR